MLPLYNPVNLYSVQLIDFANEVEQFNVLPLASANG